MISPSPLSSLHGDEKGHDHSSPGTDAFSSVGLALVLGFIFMLLVDQCSRSSGSNSGSLEGGMIPQSSSKRSFTATLGLVVHAAGW